MRIRLIVSFVSLLTIASLSIPAQAQTARPAAAQPARAPRPQGILLFVLTTGIEDIQSMNSVFRHAKTAAETQRLQEVVVLIYGRGVQALDGSMGARPAQTAQMVRDAMAAGVKVQVCAHALENMGVVPERLDPQPSEIVPNAIATLVDYVARGAAVVRY
jgi:intracellular sulfur oxidation DsrE/DsrF family protein